MNKRPQKVRVLAVDAAPGKPSTVFDGKNFKELSGSELREFLNHPSTRTGETLVCWDAPLTGPANPASAGTSPGDFTQRPIEKFFRATKLRDLQREFGELMSRIGRLSSDIEGVVAPLTQDQRSRRDFYMEMLEVLSGEAGEVVGQ